MFSQTNYSQFHTKSISDLTFYSPKTISKISNRTIFNGLRNNHKEQHLKLIKTKKKIKARLMYLINTQLLTDEPPKILSDDKIIPVKKEKRLKLIITNNQPNLIGKDTKFTNRINDNYILPSEIIYKNFKEEEVDLIGSDPEYFKPKKYEDEFDSVDILKKRKLLEILDKEEIDEEVKLKKSNHKSLSTISADKIVKNLSVKRCLPGIQNIHPFNVLKPKKTLLQTIYPNQNIQMNTPIKSLNKKSLDFNTFSHQKITKFKQPEETIKYIRLISKGEFNSYRKDKRDLREKVLETSEKIRDEKYFIRNCISEIKNTFSQKNIKLVRNGIKKPLIKV